VRRYFASTSDRGIALYLDERGNKGVITDRASV
jgi:hypothetical protein